MTENIDTNDSIDERSTDTSVSRRKLLQGAAASAVGITGLGLTSGSVAAGSRNRLVVVAADSGRHEYEIEMASGGSIQKGSRAGSNDSVSSQGGNQRVQGEVWNNNRDSYTYAGEINYVEGDGSLRFLFPDGAFERMDDVQVIGQGSGRHRYSIETDEGDIDLNPDSTEYVDSDDGGPFSEWMINPDSVSGAVRNDNRDSYSLESGSFGATTEINEITLKQGQVRFGTAGTPVQTTLTCSYELTIDHSNRRIRGTYGGRVDITVEFSPDRSEVRILNFPDIQVSYQTRIGQVTTTVSRTVESGRKTGSFDENTGRVRMPLDLDFDHSTPAATGSTASFDLTTGTRDDHGFSLSGSRLQRNSLELGMVGATTFEDGFLGGTPCSLKIEGSFADSPF